MGRRRLPLCMSIVLIAGAKRVPLPSVIPSVPFLIAPSSSISLSTTSCFNTNEPSICHPISMDCFTVHQPYVYPSWTTIDEIHANTMAASVWGFRTPFVSVRSYTLEGAVSEVSVDPIRSPEPDIIASAVLTPHVEPSVSALNPSSSCHGAPNDERLEGLEEPSNGRKEGVVACLSCRKRKLGCGSRIFKGLEPCL